MKLTKPNDSFNQYRMELTFSELKAIHTAMKSSHPGAIADEVYAGLNFYLERLPEPGEDPDKDKETSNKPDPNQDSVNKSFSFDLEKELPKPPGGRESTNFGGYGPGPDKEDLDSPPGFEDEGGEDENALSINLSGKKEEEELDEPKEEVEK